MPAAVLHLEGDRIIEQGSFWTMTLRYPGNVAQARMRGQIREKFGGELLAEFQFGRGRFDETSNRTSFEMVLRAGITEKIPVPEPGQKWVYDVVIFLPPIQEPTRLLQGSVSVSAGVTDV